MLPYFLYLSFQIHQKCVYSLSSDKTCNAAKKTSRQQFKVLQLEQWLYYKMEPAA